MPSRIDAPNTDADRSLRELLSGDPHSFVLKAGAGSGKTTSLVKALAAVEEFHGAAMRRNQQQVACITYTEVAAAEIFGEVKQSPLFQVSTIHSFLWSVINPFQRDLHRWVKGRVEQKIPTEQNKLERARTPKTVKRYTKSLEKAKADLAALPQVSRFGYQTASRFREGLIGHSDVIAAGPELIESKSLLADIVAQRYPFIFVDESQDTFEHVVEALAESERRNRGFVCIGYFGDPMQQIYPTGIGELIVDPTWTEITKPENFRCPTAVLDVINDIRGPVDGLRQDFGRHEWRDGESLPVEGYADLFVLPSEAKSENLTLVRQWLSQEQHDSKWVDEAVPSEELKLLVIEHRIAALRLGFADLFEVFSSGLGGMSIDFREGAAWPLRLFQEYLLPLAEADARGDSRNVMRLIRRFAAPQLAARLEDDDPAAGLGDLRAAVGRLRDMFGSDSDATVKDALKLVEDDQIGSIDDRLSAALAAADSDPTSSDEDDEDDDDESYLTKYLRVPLLQLIPYKKYVDGLTSYATQQGVKGAEFERVLVVLDDEDSKHFQFSYDKMFGLAPLSAADRKHIESEAESVLDRTRRLLYVCCSRATKALAVVLYAKSPEDAVRGLSEQGPFPKHRVHTVDDLVKVDGSAVASPTEGDAIWTLF